MAEERLGKRFYANINRFRESYPKEAVWLPEIPLIGVPDPLTVEEAKNWVLSLDLEGIEVLYIYGVGGGNEYLELKKWLKAKRLRRLIFLEDDLRVVRRLFASEIGSKILKDTQVELHVFKEIKDVFPFTKLAWQSLGQKISIEASPAYDKIKAEKFDALKRKLALDAFAGASLVFEFKDYGKMYYNNFYANLPALAESYLGSRFFKQFKGVPAIICGAGPSLKKNAPLLKELQKSAVIFAPGSSLNVLTKMGIKAHFAAGCDPTESQYDRLKETKGGGLPFFYRFRIIPKALQEVSGPKLYIPGSGGYRTAPWFESELGVPLAKEAEIDEGYNVVNFCTEIAARMGCNPIIFIGLDLAYTDRQAYAEGVNEKRAIAEDAIEWNDVFGKAIETQWIWAQESNWLTQYASEHPDITFINATEGGIGAKNVPNMAFKEVIEKKLTAEFPVQETIDKTLKSSRLKISLKKIDSTSVKLKESLKRSLIILDDILKELGKIQRQVLDKKLLPEALKGPNWFFLERQLREEPAYDAVLHPFERFYMVMMLKVTKGKKPKTTTRAAVKILDLERARLEFLQSVIKVNLEAQS